MAALQLRNASWRILFRYQGQQHALTLGKLPENEARLRLARVEEILLKIKQGWSEVPSGCPITEFIEKDGKAPQAKAVEKSTTYGQLRERYTAVISNGSIEPNTLYTLKIHLIQTVSENRVEWSAGVLFRIERHKRNSAEQGVAGTEDAVARTVESFQNMAAGPKAS